MQSQSAAVYSLANRPLPLFLEVQPVLEVVHHGRQPLAQLHLWLPAQQLLCLPQTEQLLLTCLCTNIKDWIMQFVTIKDRIRQGIARNVAPS